MEGQDDAVRNSPAQSNMATRRLEVKVCEAHGVVAALPSELYCRVECGESTGKTELVTAPQWQQEFEFGDTSILGDRVVFTVSARHGGEAGASSSEDVVLGVAVLEIERLTPNTRQHIALPLGAPAEADVSASVPAADAELVVEVYFECEEVKTKEEEDVEQVKEDIEAEKEKEEGEEVPLPELPVLLPRVTSDAVSLHEEPAHEEPVPAPAPAPAPSVVVPPTLSPMSSSISDAPDLPPNTIVLTILEARDLVARDGTGPEASSDPLVKISCSKNDPQRTRVLKKTLRPKWRQRFFFYLTHSRQVIDLRVEDDDMFTNDFLGRCTIDLEQWRAQFPNDKRVMWIALEPKKATGDASVSDLSPDRSMSYGLGKICVAIELRHIDREIESLEQGETDHATVVPSSRSAQATNGNIASPTATSQSVVDESFTEMQLGDGEEAAPLSPVGSVASAAAFAGEESDSDDESVQQETADEIKKRQEERQKMFAELSDVRIVPGDYQILVRIIEVRDLKPMDVNGLCDPVVSVECLGQRQHTMVKQKQLSCVFDEYLAFNFKGLEADAVQEGSIKITVLDADGPGLTAVSSSKVVSRLASDTIGFFVVDIPYVYFQKNHELHRKWVALVGAGKDNSDSIQGYLLLSIAVIGPGDKIRIHPPEEDEEAEDAVTSVKSKKDINSLVLVPPRVTQTLSYLVVTIYQAQDIPNMDAGLVNRGGVDGYARVYFAGLDVLETKRVTVKGTGNLTVEFNQELWFPILLPTMSNNIFISLWDWDMTTDELVGNMAPYLFYQVQKYPELFGPHWTNLYGPPVGVSTDSRARKRMFEHPKTASTYRGRVLLSLRVEDGSKSVNGRPHTRNLTAAMPQVPTRSYILRAALFFGTEIPQFASMTSWNRNSKMGIKITIGRHELVSTREHNRMGTCSWNQYIDLPDIELPMDLEYVPDVFVYLYRRHMNDLRCMCFARFSAKDVFCPAETLEGLREIPQPTWVSFQEDRAMDDLKDHDFTGNVLMNLRLEGSPSSAVAPDLAQRWRQHAAKNLSYTKYTVLVHVFQAKCLPATDSNGSLDPYVTVTCAGAKGQVSKRLCTRDPCFYETVCLDVELPKDEAFLPKVSVQVFDYDQWDTDDYIGSAKFSLTDVRLMSSTEYKTQREQGTYAPPRPSWHPISHTILGDTDGELLLSVELVRKDTPGAVVEPPESIHPPMEDQFLEITCLGCRGLQPVGFMPLNTPFLRFEVGDSTKNSTVRYTNPSAKPSGRNPNILERVVIPVKMPVDALYAPRLNITVFDQLLGGFYKPMLGSCSVDLSTKMPLSNGQPNPVYRDNLDEAFEGNPYVSRPTDYSTFPGTIPVSSSTTSSEDTPENPKPMLTKASQSDVGVGVAPLTSKLSLHLKASDLDDGDDDEDLPPYLHRREIMDGPLEEELSKPPFKTFSLFRGDMIARKRLLGGTSEADFRSVGKFKGIVRLLKHKDEPPLLNLDQFLMPQSYLVRVYVLDAANIQPKDENNKSDPYLRLSLGDGRKRHHLINDRHNYCKATLTPKFHKMYEFKAQLPGASELRIEVLDYDFLAIPTIPIGVSNGLTSVGTTVGGDDFIGATIIDLEDRWFSSKWQEMGADGESYEKRKPLELRPLYAPFSSLPQGNIRLWVDILTEPEMAICKPHDISLPPRRQFEVRVVVYRARNVTPGDFTDLSDLFVKCWLQSRDDKAQVTDTHWRARDGKASFNWRMKFNIELPIDDDNEADKGYLHLQLWDKDLVYDDCLADSVVDLSMFLRQAYRSNQVVNVFAKKKQVRMRGLSSASNPKQMSTMHSESSSEDAVTVSMSRASEASRPLLQGSSRYDRNESSASGRSTPQRSPSYHTSPSSTRPQKKRQSAEQRKEQAESLVKSIRNMFGMGDDAEDASWLTFTTRDPVTGDRVRAGELLVSVEILPVAVAQVRAAGLGRSQPNNFPVLQEPVGRLHLSAMWNPLYVLEALIGPKYYGAFKSAMVCALVVAVLIFAGPLINTIVTLLDHIPFPYGFIVFGVLVLAATAAFYHFVRSCRRAIQL